MPIEKAFAIHGSPYDIYAALERDISDARAHDETTFEVLRKDPGRSIDLRVMIAGVPCYLTYTLKPKPDHTEVAATLVPYGWKYVLFQIITLGLRSDGFAIALVQGLSNLKEEVEGTAIVQEAADEDDPPAQ